MAKLVRDKIVDQIIKEQSVPHFHNVEGVEYAMALWDKFREEVIELEEAIDNDKDRDMVLEEIADIITVLEAISRNVFKANIATVIEHKLDVCGGFDTGTILRGVER